MTGSPALSGSTNPELPPPPLGRAKWNGPVLDCVSVDLLISSACPPHGHSKLRNAFLWRRFHSCFAGVME